MAYSAFQSNSFQSNAFQIVTGGEEAPAQQNSAGFPAYDSTKDTWSRKYDKRRLSDRVDLLSSRIEALPEPVQAAIETAVNIESLADRRARMAEMLAVEKRFLMVYIQLMESYRDAWIMEQLAIEMERKRQKDEEEAILLLLLSQ